MERVVIVSAVRTPIGTFGGSLSQVPAPEFGALVIREAVKRAGISPDQLDEVIMGNVLQTGQGQNPARQAAVKAEVPLEVPAWTVSKVCGSGLKAVVSAVQAIAAGDGDIIVAGGMENMSLAPYILPKARTGYRMGNQTIVDTLVHDGLTDALYGIHMGITAENLAEQFGLSRQDQDYYALQSQNRAERAIKAGRFEAELVPVSVPQRKGPALTVRRDEFPRFGTTYEALAKLAPAFKQGGTVTAGNASGINDGAAAVVVMSKAKAQSLGLKPLATIISWASAGVDPRVMGIGPVPATRKALIKAGLTIKDIGLAEVNEAFACQTLAVAKELELAQEKTNVNGGAIALGHPIGASGTRILVSLIHEMERREVKCGLATLCIGGGQGIAIVVEREGAKNGSGEKA